MAAAINPKDTRAAARYLLGQSRETGNQIKPLVSACKVTSRSPAYGKERSTGLKGPRAVLLASWLRLAFAFRSENCVRALYQISDVLKTPGNLLPLLDADVNSVHSRPADRGKLSCRGSSPLLLCGPPRGPRVSSATWHRLVSAACCLGCLPASGHHLLAGHLASPVCPSCMHWCWCACSGHLLLGAPTQRVKRTSCAESTAVSTTHRRGAGRKVLARCYPPCVTNNASWTPDPLLGYKTTRLCPAA
jgi:hypothetical protein